MKKIVLFFTMCFFANISVVFGAFFHAETVEKVIKEYFPQNVWADAAAEYQAQMNPTTGEIDEEGMANFCYVGGFDIATPEGATTCAEIVQAAQSECVYGIQSYWDKYWVKAQSDIEEKQKCIVETTIDWAIDNYEGTTINRDTKDKGNLVKNEATGKVEATGVTRYGITRSSGLSNYCIERMTREDALKYYFTRHFRKYGFYKLPLEVEGVVLQLSIGGAPTAYNEILETIGCSEQECGAIKAVGSSTQAKVEEWIEQKKSEGEDGIDLFNKTITDIRAQKRSGKHVIRAQRTYSDLVPLLKEKCKL